MMKIIRSFSWIVYLLIIRFSDEKPIEEKIIMDKICGSQPIVLQGDINPGLWLRLTNNNKYSPNLNCSVKFRTSLPSQKLVVTMEKMDIIDCPGDFLYIYDGTTLLNKEIQQQCGTRSSFTFTTKTNEMLLNFNSNRAIESSGFQMAVALHFPAVTTCPRNLGFFLCKNGNCISNQLQCDGHNHCGDNTDEQICLMNNK